MRQTVFPGGATIAVTSSWDGGSAFDQRLASVLDQYGWRGTIFLRAGELGGDGRLTAEQAHEILTIGHEIGVRMPLQGIIEDQTVETVVELVEREREALSSTLLAPVRSFAHPPALPAAVGDRLTEALRRSGYSCSRTTDETDVRASAICDWMRIPVTARALTEHFDLRDRWERIAEAGDGIFHLWGASEECGDDDDRWAELECNLAWFCGHGNVWYCTLGELASHFVPEVGLVSNSAG